MQCLRFAECFLCMLMQQECRQHSSYCCAAGRVSVKECCLAHAVQASNFLQQVWYRSQTYQRCKALG
jgi:hypothetical protein